MGRLPSGHRKTSPSRACDVVTYTVGGSSRRKARIRAFSACRDARGGIFSQVTISKFPGTRATEFALGSVCDRERRNLIRKRIKIVDAVAAGEKCHRHPMAAGRPDDQIEGRVARYGSAVKIAV